MTEIILKVTFQIMSFNSGGLSLEEEEEFTEVKTSKILNIPLLVTEQNPKGLGKTVQELDIAHAYHVYPKTRFSMLVPELVAELGGLCDNNLECVVLFGIEAHVCVEQTAAELCARGIQVHIAADASTSRSQEDRLLAFQRLKQMGCFITTSETVIFKLLGDKEHPKFADIRPLIKTTSPNTGLANISKM
uniref:Isochorismatase domain-containing protein 1 n=2 Tax=Timema TaxID=61471 RepID=A0A7R9DYR7_9NEOP|nr:unnamed protein product [Timema monikensis]